MRLLLRAASWSSAERSCGRAKPLSAPTAIFLLRGLLRGFSAGARGRIRDQADIQASADPRTVRSVRRHGRGRADGMS